MTKTLLLTGATDGIGLETAKALSGQGHSLILHGRNRDKLTEAKRQIEAVDGAARLEMVSADLSDLDAVARLANDIAKRDTPLDGVINNAGVFATPHPITASGLDVRFVVNTLAPYILTKRLLPLMGSHSRVVNVSSAAQAPINLQALRGEQRLDDNSAYAQSKLAITLWTRALAQILGTEGPVLIAVNPASFLGSKMVKQAYGMQGKDLNIGVDILTRALMSDEFQNARGAYYDNDHGTFANPHPDALDPEIVTRVMAEIDRLTAPWLSA